MALTADEQHLLDQLEASLRAEDPGLARKFEVHRADVVRRPWALAGLLFVLGIALLVTGMLLVRFWISVFGFLAMFAGVAVLVLRPHRQVDANTPADQLVGH